MTAASDGRRIAILGAGHAHLEVIRRLRPLTRAGIEAVIVDPEDFWYSGLATGMLGGQYEIEQDRVAVDRLARQVGARFLRDHVEHVDPGARVVRLASGDSFRYDLASLNLGSRVPVDRVEGLGSYASTAKPIRHLAELRADLVRRFAEQPEHPTQPPRLLVIGGGATACELAANLRALAHRGHCPASITLLASGARLLDGLPASAARTMATVLERSGITVQTGAPVVRVEPGEVLLQGGHRLGFEVIVAATGLVAPELMGQLGLPTDREGRLRLDPFLRSIGEPTLFAGGDCATLDGLDLPRIGVVAVRQGPVLAHNLRATLLGGRLRRYRPQRRWLQILNLGDGTGLACWGPYSIRGRAMLVWKDLLDRRFLRRYRTG